MERIDRLDMGPVVPVAVIENEEDAVPTAKALIAGGIDVMEITLRTEAGIGAIRRVSEEVPEMLTGAGTVISLQQCREAVKAGARFIVSPGYDEETVSWCVENGISVFPGCVTPTEIMAAMKHGLKVLKFFPADVYGGLAAMRSLAGPFGGIQFIPTGGINGDNVSAYAAAPFVYAVGGSWLCTKKDIAEKNFGRITALCREAVEKIHKEVNKK